MSYEKLSGIKLNAKTNTILLKSHSNNDDATPTWWEYISNKETSFNEKLKCLYMSFAEGNLQSNSLTGTFLKLKYAFNKFGSIMKNAIGISPWSDNSLYALTYEEINAKEKVYHEQREKFMNDNFNLLNNFLEEKDSNAKFVVLYQGYFPIMNISRYGVIRYLCGRCSKEKKWTKKQVCIIEDILKARNIDYVVE